MIAQNTNDPIGFIGLGALGEPLAANLLSAGKSLVVWNRTASKAEPLALQGAKIARQPSDAVTRGGVVLSILWDDASLEELVQSDGFLSALGPGGVHVSMTTVTPDTAKKLAALHEAQGSIYVEAPIFGPPPQAVARQLVICLAGPTAAKQRVHPLLEAMGGQRIVDFGERIGAATATKLVGNFMIISSFVAMQEAFAALTRSGVDPKPTLDMLTTTLLATPGNQRLAAILTSGSPVPKSRVLLKDVGLFQLFAERANAPATLAKQMREILVKDEGT